MRMLRIAGLVLAVVIGAALTLGAAIAAYDYLWGSPLPNDLVVVTEVTARPEAVALKGFTVSSALNYRRYAVRTRDGRMTVTLRWSLLHSSDGAVDISIPTDGENVEEVYLSDGTDVRRIYP